LGVLSALMQHDLKRLLAYHTVENIGIIFIGLGLALAFSAHGMRAAAAVAMTAALLHVLNHSIFKSLLFFGSGAVLTATGARDMEHLGGLIRGMPLTAFTFLAGCMAISALPPPVNMLVAARMPIQSADPWLSIVPVAESRSSYNGLLVFVFITLSTLIAIEIIHRFASHALRRSPAWDCGFPDPSPATQYSAGSFAQPIRRVFGSVVFRAREAVAMPKPGDTAVARLQVELHDTVWDVLYAPIIRLAAATA